MDENFPSRQDPNQTEQLGLFDRNRGRLLLSAEIADSEGKALPFTEHATHGTRRTMIRSFEVSEHWLNSQSRGVAMR